MIDCDGYTDEWFATESEWSAEPRQEPDCVRKLRELQSKQPAALKPKPQPISYKGRKTYDGQMLASGDYEYE
jgi:hypothetical protein